MGLQRIMPVTKESWSKEKDLSNLEKLPNDHMFLSMDQLNITPSINILLPKKEMNVRAVAIVLATNVVIVATVNQLTL